MKIDLIDLTKKADECLDKTPGVGVPVHPYVLRELIRQAKENAATTTTMFNLQRKNDMLLIELMTVIHEQVYDKKVNVERTKEVLKKVYATYYDN